MKLPIDIPAVLKAATDIKGAAETPISVSLIIDDTATGALVGHVRSQFTSAGAHTRITMVYIGQLPASPSEDDDMAVIVAGSSPSIGATADAVRQAGVPVMVVTDCPQAVADTAAAMGHDIPDGDLIFPHRQRLISLQRTSELDEAHIVEEPIELTEEHLFLLDERMGRWVISTCAAKKLAFALAFTFMRRPLSLDSVNATSLQNAGIGVVAFIPGADLPIMTLNQAKMLLQIAAAYGQPMDAGRIKELAAVVGGAFLMRNLARQLVKLIPVLGWLIKGLVGFTGTQAMGRAAIDYFEAGGDIVGLANVVQHTRDEVVEKAAEVVNSPAGQKVITRAKGALSAGVSRLRSHS